MYTNAELQQLKDNLYSGVLADMLDEYGYRENVMRADIRPLENTMKIFGRAFTVLATDVYSLPEVPYKLVLETVDTVGEGDIYVVNTNGSTSCGYWGELLTTCVEKNGCVGAIVDGMIRDASQIIERQFPVFTRGFCARDSKGRIEAIDYNVPIECGNVRIEPGDYIFGDIDGIVVIPKDIARQVIDEAIEKIEAEDTAREDLNQGLTAKQMFEKYGVL